MSVLTCVDQVATKSYAKNLSHHSRRVPNNARISERGRLEEQRMKEIQKR